MQLAKYSRIYVLETCHFSKVSIRWGPNLKFNLGNKRNNTLRINYIIHE